MQTAQRNELFLLPAMLIGTIDFYHFMPLSLTLTLPGAHKVSTKQILLASFSPTLFHFSSDQDEMWCCDEAIQAEHPETNFQSDLLKQGK